MSSRASTAASERVSHPTSERFAGGADIWQSHASTSCRSGPPRRPRRSPVADGERIDAIRARLEAAPAGPYRLQSRIFRHDIFDVAGKLIESIAEEAEGRTPALGLAELIATAPADIEFLLAEAERLRRLIVSLL